MDSAVIPSLQMDHPAVLSRPLVAHEPIAKRVRVDSVLMRVITVEKSMEVQEPTEQHDSDGHSFTLGATLEKLLTCRGRYWMQVVASLEKKREAVLPARETFLIGFASFTADTQADAKLRSLIMRYTKFQSFFDERVSWNCCKS